MLISLSISRVYVYNCDVLGCQGSSEALGGNSDLTALELCYFGAEVVKELDTDVSHVLVSSEMLVDAIFIFYLFFC